MSHADNDEGLYLMFERVTGTPVRRAADGVGLVRSHQVWLLCLRESDPPPARYIADAARGIYLAFLESRFVETSFEVEPGDTSNLDAVCARALDAWVRGKLTLKDASYTELIPQRPPATKAQRATWKLAGKDIEAAERAWFIFDSVRSAYGR